MFVFGVVPVAMNYDNFIIVEELLSTERYLKMQESQLHEGRCRITKDLSYLHIGDVLLHKNCLQPKILRFKISKEKRSIFWTT